MNIELCDSFNSIDTKMRCFRDRKVWDLDRRASGHNLLMHAPMCYAMQRLWSHQKCDANSSDEKLGRWQRHAAFENENLNLPDLRISQREKKTRFQGIDNDYDLHMGKGLPWSSSSAKWWSTDGVTVSHVIFGPFLELRLAWIEQHAGESGSTLQWW